MSSAALEIIGWIAALSALVAYGLSEAKIIRAGGGWHIFLNATCGVLFMIVGVSKGVSSMVFLNGVWLLIALYSFTRLYNANRKPTDGIAGAILDRQERTKEHFHFAEEDPAQTRVTGYFLTIALHNLCLLSRDRWYSQTRSL